MMVTVFWCPEAENAINRSLQEKNQIVNTESLPCVHLEKTSSFRSLPHSKFFTSSKTLSSSLSDLLHSAIIRKKVSNVCNSQIVYLCPRHICFYLDWSEYFRPKYSSYSPCSSLELFAGAGTLRT